MKIQEYIGGRPWKFTAERPVIGIDIGSSSSKAVLLSKDDIYTVVVPTGLYTQETADELVEALLKQSGFARKDIASLVGTGYGRIALQFDDIPFEVITEIRCHAMGAHVVHPDTRTIIDIGGQDSKAIKIDQETGRVIEFVMNDKCAAGTGRFLEKSAATLGVELVEFGKLSLEAVKPAQVSSQCVVFAETEIISLRAKGDRVNDHEALANIAAGVHLSAARRVQNLLGRVGIEPGLTFTGGVSNNPGMRATLEQLLGSTFNNSNFNLVLAGALGAAVYAQKAALALARKEEKRSKRAQTIEVVGAARPARKSPYGVFNLREFQDLIHQEQESFIQSDNGQKRFGYQCNYTPLELLSAAGARHIRLFKAGDSDTVALGERYTQSIYCDFSKSCLGSFAAGDPLYKAIDKVYNFYTCNTVKRVSEVMEKFVPVKLLNLPKLRNEVESRKFFRLELIDLKKDLEHLTGKKIRDEDIQEQIVLQNKVRRQLKAISELRKKPFTVLTGKEYLELAKGYYYLPAEKALAAYEKIYQQLSAVEAPENGEQRLRFLVSGSTLADGDRRVHDILENDFNGRVVAEDVCTGVRPFYHTVPESGDPLDNLVAGYLDQAPCARMKPLTDAAQFAADLGVEYQVDGVLFTYLKFCPTHSVGMKEYILAFHRAGLPVLELSNDYSHNSEGQLKTRIEAFLEVLNDKRASVDDPQLASV